MTHQYQAELDAILDGSLSDPFGFFGLHPSKDGEALELRVFMPGAESVECVAHRSHEHITTLEMIDPEGLFVGTIDGHQKPFPYNLRIKEGDQVRIQDDPYRFAWVLGEMDIYLLAEGTHYQAFQKMGAQLTEMGDVQGVSFAVWAPNAKRVSVVGDFNNWDGRRHQMRMRHEVGVWEIFVPGMQEGDLYMYEIKHAHGYLLPLKADPYAFGSEVPPKPASVVTNINAYQWQDEDWMKDRGSKSSLDAPISVYEVNFCSWKRVPEYNNRFLTYMELADQLIPYVQEMGFTHIEIMPIHEFPFLGSWGYQPTGLYAPTSRYGSAKEFQAFVDRCHQANIGVILDWVPGHFPADDHGLANFDGTALYEHVDPRKGYHPDWNTLIYNYGRNEVSNFLVSNANYWIEKYHIDGLRVDAVASMLYLNYSRSDGEWIPNKYGDNKNLEAIDFIRHFNRLIHAKHPGVVTIAEESTSWPGVSRPETRGGLGFDFKWNLGWMHDSLSYMKHDPVYRKYHHDAMTFGLVYAFKENFVLPLSHDEVVHLKKSLLGRMPGDEWQRFANLRAYYGFMWAHPGKKLLFMGGEFAQINEWNHDASLDWHLLENKYHAGIQRLVCDLNNLYKNTPALFQQDCEPQGFEWIKVDCRDLSLFAFIRQGLGDSPPVLVISNFTPLPRGDFRLGVPQQGRWTERLNTDLEIYCGSNVHNMSVEAKVVPWDGQPYSIVVTIPPLSTVFFELESA